MAEQQIRDADWLSETLVRMAGEIVKLAGEDTVYLTGIRARGPLIAQRLADIIERSSDKKTRVGAIDIRLQRDDFHLRGAVTGHGGTILPAPIDDREIFLVDDVIRTGRSTRAALNELLDNGRPKAVRLVTLIDRGGREFPIQPDVVGEWIDTPDDSDIAVELAGFDEQDRILRR